MEMVRTDEEVDCLMLEFDVSHKLQSELLINLLKYGDLIRDELVAMSEWSRTYIYQQLMNLGKMGYVKKYTKPNNKKGRPLVYFSVIINEE